MSNGLNLHFEAIPLVYDRKVLKQNVPFLRRDGLVRNAKME